MMTSNFWQVLSRVGAGALAKLDWQHHFGDDWPTCQQFLKKSSGYARTVVDMEHPCRRLDVVPDGEDGFLGMEADDVPTGPPVRLGPADVALHAVNWQAVALALGETLGFEVLLIEAEGYTRQVGIRKKDQETVQPVVLCLPSGTIGERNRMLSDLAARKDSTLLLPSADLLDPVIHSLTTANQLEVICLAESLQKSGSKPLLTKSTRPKKPRQPLFPAKADWHWQKLTVEVADGGRIIASYGSERKEHFYGKSSQQSYKKDYEILLHVAAKGRWTNPHSSTKENESVRKQFYRFRKDFKALIGIPDAPFVEEGDDWIPKFEVRLHGDLLHALKQQPTDDDDAWSIAVGSYQ